MKTRYYISAVIPVCGDGPLCKQRYTESGMYGTETFTFAYPGEFGGPTLYQTKEAAEAKFQHISEKFGIPVSEIQLESRTYYAPGEQRETA